MPATATTQGYAKWYFDDVQVGNTITWNQYNPATPPSPVNGSSAYSVMDARHLYLILGSGPSNPMTVYNVQVWQKSTANDIGTLQTLLTHPAAGATQPLRPARTEPRSPPPRQARSSIRPAIAGPSSSQRRRDCRSPATASSIRSPRRSSCSKLSAAKSSRRIPSVTGSQNQAPTVHGRRSLRPRLLRPAPTEPRSPPPRQARSSIRPAIAGPSSSQRRRDCRSPATASSTRSPRRSSCSKLSAAKSSRRIPTVTGSQNQAPPVHGRRSLRLPSLPRPGPRQ